MKKTWATVGIIAAVLLSLFICKQMENSAQHVLTERFAGRQDSQAETDASHGAENVLNVNEQGKAGAKDRQWMRFKPGAIHDPVLVLSLEGKRE